MKQEKLQRKVYEWELRRRKGRGSWALYTKRLLLELGLGDYWEEQAVKESKGEWGELISKKIHEREQKVWWRTVLERPKLRTYRLFKKKLEFEQYLEI